jgi:precorrin-4/cobalt-precorrin-4 C11-methyltransferase
MAIFLSASVIEKVVAELLAGGYHPDTPAAVVYRATWKDELVLRTTLSNLLERVKASGITKQALILVGAFLGSKGKRRRSKLYS